MLDEDEEEWASFPGDFTGPKFYPEVMSHPCLTRTHRIQGEDYVAPAESKRDKTTFLRFEQCERRPWTAEPLYLNQVLGELAANVVAAVGLDPTTTSTTEMDALPVYLLCDRCQKDAVFDGNTELVCHGWRSAVRPFFHVHRC
jgi:hypothetical protein